MQKNSLDKKYIELEQYAKRFAGYPTNLEYDYSELLPFFTKSINNVGDPFGTSNYHINTHDFEQDVIAFIAGLYGLTTNYWGYITTGGTEGNLEAINIARNIYPNGEIFYSDQAHYSIPKAISITRSVSHCIPSLDNGEIDYTVLEHKLSVMKHVPIIIILNLGTTMKGAIDDVHKVKRIIKKLGINEFYIHYDAALHGLIVPFLELKQKVDLKDFDSISISGHKLIGSPIPCGVFLTHVLDIEKYKNFIEYVNTNDLTITGSRNGITPLIIWFAIHRHRKKGFHKIVDYCMKLTQYTLAAMKKNGIDAWANQYSPIVIFPQPSNHVIQKWQLPVYQGISHIVILLHLKKTQIDELVEDLVLDRKGLPLKIIEKDEKNNKNNYILRDFAYASVGFILSSIIFNIDSLYDLFIDLIN